MKPIFRHILVVQQHGKDDALALQRAIALAEQYNSRLTIFKSFYHGLPKAVVDTLQEPATAAAFATQQQRLVHRQVDHLTKHNLALNINISWQQPEPRALAQFLSNSDISLVVSQQLHRKGWRALLADQLEHFLISDCELPVWLVKANTIIKELSILACLDIDGNQACSKQLNDAILDIGDEISQQQADQLHVINCYTNDDLSMSLPYHSDTGFEPLADIQQQHCAKITPLLKQHRLERAHLHLSEGLPDDEIPRTAHQLHSDVAVIGNNHMHSLGSVLWGDTAHYLTEHTPCDVLIVKPAISEQTAVR